MGPRWAPRKKKKENEKRERGQRKLETRNRKREMGNGKWEMGNVSMVKRPLVYSRALVLLPAGTQKLTAP